MKQKIALLISGRITCYESCLLPILDNSSNDYEIHLFMSINSKTGNNNYFRIMKEKLVKYLKCLTIKEYLVPNDFINNSTHPQTVKQYINGKYVPRNILSTFYNYKNAYNLALEYEKQNNELYDFYMTFRSDFIIEKLPLFNNIDNDVLYSINLPCYFNGFGLYNKPIISHAWVYSKCNVMKQYMDTYNFIMEQNKKDNNYIMHFESNVTDNCYDKGMKIIYISNIKYNIDANRRRFDNWEELKDTRKYNIKKRTTEFTNIDDITEQQLILTQNIDL